MGVISSPKSLLTDGHLVDIEGGSLLKPSVFLKMHLNTTTKMEIGGKLSMEFQKVQTAMKLAGVNEMKLTATKLGVEYVG